MKPQKALFLDRDGIINIDSGYVHTKAYFVFSKGIFDLLKLFIQQGYLLFIVTNQSGIGRGYYTLKDFEILTEWMIKQLADKGIEIQSVMHCPHLSKDACHCRKPQIGMIESILKNYSIDLNHSWLIGDKQSDIDLARNSHILSHYLYRPKSHNTSPISV
ncbi:MAG: HAD family hydrolase [Sulfurovum sp.]|nr:HAD family hydrolase [Sulfurovum sp.]